MKKTVLLLTLVTAMPLLAQDVPKQPPRQNQPATPKQEGKLPTKKDYKLLLHQLTTFAVNVDNPKTYENIEFNVLGKQMLFKDMGEFEKSLIYLWSYRQLETKLRWARMLWVHELAYLKDKKVAPSKDDSGEATKEDIEGFIAELHELHCNVAVKHEVFAEQTFEKFNDKIPVEEMAHYLKTLKNSHDALKLIDRKGNAEN